ncbi:MAG TPA: type II toxin-antitoxin system RelE/ParE family toxin [Thermoanaerobaculia bacterium]|jgi:toxin ParE1/3/4
MRLKWSQAAIRDLQEIRGFIAQERPMAAQRVAQRILQVVRNLEQFPRMGRPGRVEGTRELVVGGTPYLVPYRVQGEAVELLRILHGARRWPERF